MVTRLTRPCAVGVTERRRKMKAQIILLATAVPALACADDGPGRRGRRRQP